MGRGKRGGIMMNMKNRVMRVVLNAGLAIVLLGAGTVSVEAANSKGDPGREARWSILAKAGLISPADGDYRKLYGSTKFYPEITAELVVASGFSAWASLGRFSGSGVLEVFDERESLNSVQTILSFGAGFRRMLTDRFGAKVRIGLAWAGYKEEALGMEVTGSGLGMRLGASGFYLFGRGLFGEAGLDWISASDETEEGIKLKLGGLILSAGIGIRF
jgi:hypothetical protein